MTAVGGVDADRDGEDGGESDGEPSLLDDLAPSAKLVAKVLEEEGSLSFGRVVRCTRLPRATARNGVERLVDAGLAERHHGDAVEDGPVIAPSFDAER